MQVDFSSSPHNNFTEKTNQILANTFPIVKKPRVILDRIFAFSPNRNTLGGTAYLLSRDEGNVLIDCPFWDENNFQFCQQQGGVKWLFLTHRTAISKDIKKIQQNLNCQIIIQEQEAYLLPNLKIDVFNEYFQLNSDCELIWTPGHSPGSSCLYYKQLGGVLFSGRHLLPNNKGECVPLKLKKTFHWRRQLKSQQNLSDRILQNNQGFRYICPAANTGHLKGKGFFEITTQNF